MRTNPSATNSDIGLSPTEQQLSSAYPTTGISSATRLYPTSYSNIDMPSLLRKSNSSTIEEQQQRSVSGTMLSSAVTEGVMNQQSHINVKSAEPRMFPGLVTRTARRGSLRIAGGGTKDPEHNGTSIPVMTGGEREDDQEVD